MWRRVILAKMRWGMLTDLGWALNSEILSLQIMFSEEYMSNMITQANGISFYNKLFSETIFYNFISSWEDNTGVIVISHLKHFVNFSWPLCSFYCTPFIQCKWSVFLNQSSDSNGLMLRNFLLLSGLLCEM